MITDLKPYPKYKDSNVDWLPKVPAHWDLRRLRASNAECVNGIWGTDPNGKDDIVCVRVADFDRANLRVNLRKKTLRAIPLTARSGRLLQRGDLLLEKSGGGDLQPVGAVVAYDHDETAVCSNFISRMSISDDYDSFFVNYLHFTLYAHRVNLRSIKATTGIQNLDSKSYFFEPVAFPPLDEQAAIVRFLDWASVRLERAIRAKQKVIALLNERKQAVIQNAVMRGLEPSVPLKNSHIGWLGDIPAHWELRRIKYLLREVDERSTTGNEPLLSMRMYHGLVLFAEHFNRPPQAATLVGFKIVRPGQFVVNRMQAGNGLIFASSYFGLVSPDYAVFDPIGDANVEFLGELFRSRQVRAKFRAESKGLGTGSSGFLRLYNDRLGAIHVALPPQPEQEKIVAQLAQDLLGLNTAVSRLRREIELLREYRSKLVSDVVTGQLDVREASKQLPSAVLIDSEPYDENEQSLETDPSEEACLV